MSLALGRLSLLKSKVMANETEDVTDDEFMALLLGATAGIRSYTNRRLTYDVYSEQRYSGNGTNTLLLREWPVVEVTEVRIWDGSSDFDSEDLADFDLLPDENGQNNEYYYPKLGQESAATWGVWPNAQPNNIKITYGAGYIADGWDTMEITDTFAVPGDLEMACLQFAYKWWKDGSIGGGRFGMTSIAKGPDSMSIERLVRGLPEDTKMVLNNYRRLWL